MPKLLQGIKILNEVYEDFKKKLPNTAFAKYVDIRLKEIKEEKFLKQD